MKRNLINDEVKVQTTEKGRGTGMTTRAVLKAIDLVMKKDVERVLYVARNREHVEYAQRLVFDVTDRLGFHPERLESKIKIAKKCKGVPQGYDCEIWFITDKEAEMDWPLYMRGACTKAAFD